MMMKMMGRWALAMTVLAGVGRAATADAPSSALADYAVLGLKEVTLKARSNVLSGDVGSGLSDEGSEPLKRVEVQGALLSGALVIPRSYINSKRWHPVDLDTTPYLPLLLLG